ncbi:MAG: cytidine deaminase [Hyphomicrobiaceae bacterium]
MRQTTPDQDLIRLALAARAKAHAPYSGFAVGAAVRDRGGRLHAGCNVENAAYPEGICAETAALAAMVLAGGREVVEVVVAGGGEAALTPCGGCRQRLRELGGPGLLVHAVDRDGRCLASHTLAELLPYAFGPDHLGDKSTP